MRPSGMKVCICSRVLNMQLSLVVSTIFQVIQQYLQARKEAYWRTRSAGLPFVARTALAVGLWIEEWGVWILCSCMYVYESIALGGWLK